MRRASRLISILLMAPPLAGAGELGAFSYRDSDAARVHWQPQSGSKPVRVERLPDGSTCLAFDAEFSGPKARAYWDWVAPLDLSKVGRVTFEGSAHNGELCGHIILYFGTPNGWYAGSWYRGAQEPWTPRSLRLDGFSTEGKPDGWDKVTRMRFSIWSTGAGRITYRLRNLRALAIDPAENFLRNGSFEVPDVGVPYGWGSGHWGVGDLPWAADMNLWRKHWHLDRTVAKHGQTSLCIANTRDLPLLALRSVWIKGLPKGVERCTLSAWMKSDQQKVPVVLECGQRSRRVEVGRDWTQATLGGIKRARRMSVAITPRTPGKLWVDAVQLQACAEPTPGFHPAFVDVAIAARERRVDFSAPRRTPKIAAGRTVTGPVQPATIRIDEHGRFLLDERPYLQHSFGLEFVNDLDVLDAVAHAGFRDVCIQIRETVTTPRLKDIADRCAKLGMRLIPWLDGRMTRERFAAHITSLKTHPAVLCWYVYDEPSGGRFAEADARVRLAKDLDPSRPAYINYLSTRLENQTGDIYSTDVYPIPHGSPSAAVGAVARMRDAADKEHKPVWMWLQGTGYAYWMDREPSPRELSCMCYGSLIAGARGIYYFAQFPRTRECLDEMRALCVEVDALSPVLYSQATPPRVGCNRSSLMVGSYLHDRRVWVLAVNTRDAPCRARFTLPGATGAVAVVFEDRQLDVADQGWQDDFGPYERRVYRLTKELPPLRRMQYTSRARADALAWEKTVRRELFEILALDDLLRRPIDFNAKVLSTTSQPGYSQRDIEINSTPGRRIKVVLTVPTGKSTPCPAVVCIHGHGGNRHVVHDRKSIYKGFAAELSARGAVTLSTDVGQHEVHEPGRLLMGERLWDVMRCVDYAVSLPEVDKKRIGCAGLSLGGEMAMWLGAMDERITATVSAGFLTVMDQMEQNHCMCWKFPGLRERVDYADIYALIAPRALQCQNGLKEGPTQFYVPIARKALTEIQLIYKDLGKPGNVELDVHDGGHEIDLPALMRYFAKHLSIGTP